MTPLHSMFFINQSSPSSPQPPVSPPPISSPTSDTFKPPPPPASSSSSTPSSTRSSPSPPPPLLPLPHLLRQLHFKSEFQLLALKSQFALFSKSHLLNSPSPSNLFFFTLEFKDLQSSFSLFGVNSLPHIKLVPPNVHSTMTLNQGGD